MDRHTDAQLNSFDGPTSLSKYIKLKSSVPFPYLGLALYGWISFDT